MPGPNWLAGVSTACGVLAECGAILVCDHTPFDDSAKSTTLYMSREEQQEALVAAGCANARVDIDSLVVYAGERVGC